MEALTKFLKATADPIRLQILQILGYSSYGALELSYILGLKQNSLSHHLKQLSQSGLIESRREGNSIFYRRGINSGDFENLAREVIQCAESSDLPDNILENMTMVQQEREQQSRDFFARNALRFREQQELIADFESYADVAFKLLCNQSPGFTTVLEVGPGTGEFLSRLSRQFETVTAVDVSEDMLEQASRLCRDQQLTNVTLVHGDQQSVVSEDRIFDAVVFNMVLHHVADPAAELKTAARHLPVGGVVLVTDLSRHDQEWARESCGDLWLGLDEQDLNRWAEASQLKHLQSTYVGLRNGFQIQCQLYAKQ